MEMERRTRSAPGNDAQSGSVDVEQQLSRKRGSAPMKTQGADSTCQRDFIRRNLAVGVLFQDPGSEVTWQRDGKLVLAKPARHRTETGRRRSQTKYTRQGSAEV
jgi:hypothetical protein